MTKDELQKELTAFTAELDDVAALSAQADASQLAALGAQAKAENDAATAKAEHDKAVAKMQALTADMIEFFGNPNAPVK